MYQEGYLPWYIPYPTHPGYTLPVPLVSISTAVHAVGVSVREEEALGSEEEKHPGYTLPFGLKLINVLELVYLGAQSYSALPGENAQRSDRRRYTLSLIPY